MTASARRGLTVIAVTVCLLAATYALFRASALHGAREPQVRTFRLALVDDHLAAGAPAFDVVQGDTVTLIVTSNRAGTLHVHEYEQHLVMDLQPRRTTTSSFVADRAGRYGVHLIGADGTHAQVAAVEVQPR